MKNPNFTYIFFYSSFLVVIIVAMFFNEGLLLYFKPMIPLSLILLYVNSVKKINFLFPVSLLVLAITNIFVSLDFVRYYDVIAILITSYYLLCVFLSREFISKQDIKLNKLTSPPVVISIILIVYVMFSIAELALPKIKDSLAGVISALISMLLFSAISFFIYLSDKYEKAIFLFVAACCTLVVNALLGINELYYYSRIFTVLINIVETLGIYFFTRFLLETKPVNKEFLKEKYF